MKKVINTYGINSLTKHDTSVSDLDILSFHLRTRHNIEISPEEFQNYLIIEWNNKEYKKRLIISLGYYRENVYGGRVLGLVAIAALGFFFLPALIGVSPLMGALIGAALGWRLFGFGNKNNQQQQIKADKVVSAPGFDSAPQPPQIGSVIPLIFTNKNTNPNGGIRLLGNIINSYIKTEKNTQTLYQLSSLGLGKFGRINADGLMIDSQPRDNFLVSEIETQYTLGEENQTRFIEFPFYSQAISPQNNSSLGASFRANINNNSINQNTFTVSSDDFDIFSPSDNYLLDDKEFKVNNKDKNLLTIFTTNSNLSQGNRKVFSLNKIKYKTLKRCTRLDLNLAFDIWARDSNNNLVNYASAFKLFIDNQFIGSFYEVRKKEGTIRRSITIQNLVLSSHKIELIPYSQNVTGLITGLIYRLDDSGNFRTINTGVFFNNKEVLLTIESAISNQISLADLNGFLDNTNKPQTSSDRGANGKLTSVNEIVFPNDIGQMSMINYKNLVVNRTICQASDRLQNSPAFSHDVPEAIVYRNHIAAGKASPTSFNNILIANGVDFSDCRVGYILRNITRQTESVVTAISGFQITTQFSLNFTQGDDFLIYFENAINYFPDVFVYSLISKLGGLGNIITEKFIDYPSICKSRKFCFTNSLFWDGVVDNQVSWDNWVSQESLASLLFPSKFAGNFGLLPEVFEQPKDIYTAARILPGSFSQASPNSQKINTVQLTYKYNEDGVKKDKTLTCMTGDAYFSRESLASQSLKYDSVSNEEQAKKIAARFLKSRIIQNKVVTFDVGLSGFNNREGDLIIVQFALTENQAEISATTRSVGNLLSGNQQIILSRNIPTFINPTNQKLSIYHRESGTVQTNKSFIIINSNTLVVSELNEIIKPDREQWLGDIIIITSDISERIYRISSLKPSDYSVTITCINWQQEILDSSDLFFIN